MPTPELIRSMLGILADIASIAGLIITIVVAISVRRLRASYIFKARVPELAARISEKASAVSVLAADFANTRDQIRIELIQIAGLVDSLGRKTRGPSRAAARELAKRLKSSRTRTRAEVTELYGAIQAVLVQYDELQRDLEWERQ